MGKVQCIVLLILLTGNSIFAQDSRDVINQVDANGRKQGYWIKHDESGMILYEGTFEADVPVGEFKYYYPDGQTRAVSTFSEHGKRSATTTYHYSGKAMSEGFYIDQEKDSLWRFYDINGILLKEEFYRSGQKNGTWRTFYQDGQVAEETEWQEDKKNGLWIQYFYDGTKKLEGSYLNDEKQGPITHYYPSGRARITGQYDQSYRTGTWYYMNDSSEVIKTETYEDGAVVKEENFEPEE